MLELIILKLLSLEFEDNNKQDELFVGIPDAVASILL